MSQNQFSGRILHLMKCQGSSIPTKWRFFRSNFEKDVNFAETDFGDKLGKNDFRPKDMSRRSKSVIWTWSKDASFTNLGFSIRKW